MKTEAEQKTIISNSVHPQTGIHPALADKLSTFIFSPEIWPRYRTAPASTAIRFHHAYEGGLLDHSAEVVGIGLMVNRDIRHGIVAEGQISSSDIVVVGLLHDLHKIGDGDGREYFLPNMLKNGSRSDKIPYASSDAAHHFKALPGPLSTLELQLLSLLDLYPDGWPDGVLSLSLVAAYDPGLYAMLSADVKFSIMHHAGMYDRKARHLINNNETPLMVLMHFADMLSSRREGWSKPKES